MLADSGAIESLVHERVLRRIGRASDTLRTYSGSLDSVSGHDIKVRGVIDLPVTLGTMEKVLPFVVVDRLHVDAILGTDVLKAFRANGDVVPLGSSRVEENFAADIAATVRLTPGAQALVRARLNGTLTPDTTVLVEGIVGDGQVIVEICNASTEELVIKENAQVAVAAVVPVSAFLLERELTSDMTYENKIIASSAASKELSGGDASKMSKDLVENSDEALRVDFSDSDMNEEQCELFSEMLNGFKDLFVETSKRPGRTDLLKFKIDTGTHAPNNNRTEC
ncbi:hypothetical protein PHMEG_00032112 [Phytophthora megakarya]|uniref:Peptidase A2 domain-containing protein n=1 Tax=Phytophthora megakarya TaxID=4795 RepID=A0A225UWH3_9STRA|nr:hypothetical protein PHMEG_00032112 [Phytophthora megakarya]